MGQSYQKSAHQNLRVLLRPLAKLFSNLRYGFGSLRRSPGFTTAAVMTMGLAIGANTPIFSVVNAC